MPPLPDSGARRVWALVRTGGFTGNFENDLNWRWAQTPEEVGDVLLLRSGQEMAAFRLSIARR